MSLSEDLRTNSFDSLPEGLKAIAEKIIKSKNKIEDTVEDTTYLGDPYSYANIDSHAVNYTEFSCIVESICPKCNRHNMLHTSKDSDYVVYICGCGLKLNIHIVPRTSIKKGDVVRVINGGWLAKGIGAIGMRYMNGEKVEVVAVDVDGDIIVVTDGLNAEQECSPSQVEKIN